MTRFDKIVEEMIKQGQREGKFENLSGEGKPLNLQDYPFVDSEWRLAYHAFKTSGHTLPWVEHRKAIIQDYERALNHLSRMRVWMQSSDESEYSEAFRQKEWKEAKLKFNRAIEKVNDQILTYNIEAPSTQLQLKQIDTRSDIEKMENLVGRD